MKEYAAARISGMTRRIGLDENVAFTGGVAKNIGFSVILENLLETKLYIPPEPQISGALEAAIIAFEEI